MQKIETDKPLHCMELVTGQSLTGNLTIGSDGIRADLYSYQGNFNIDVDNPLILIAQNGVTVSFHSNIDAGSGSFHSHDSAVEHQAVISNLAVVGHGPWTQDDLVKRATFSVEHTMQLLTHREKLDTLYQTGRPRPDGFGLFTEAAGAKKISAYYGATYGSGPKTPHEVWPSFEIEFESALHILDFSNEILTYVDFLSFCLGTRLAPSKIQVDRISRSEVGLRIEEQTYHGMHEVHYVWPAADVEGRNLWAGGSPAIAWDDTELSSLSACLKMWFERADSWSNSYRLMMSAFGFKNVISAERLVNACKWLEEIPIASSENALSEDEVDAIATAAAQKAREMGLTADLEKRVSGSIKRIKTETAGDRFSRLIRMIESKFGPDVLLPNTQQHLTRAMQFRGRTAHGHFHPANDDEFRAFAKSTSAVEAFCYLLTAIDLPVNEAGLTRIRQNPVLRDYRNAYD
jgi:hypothetical protein